MFEVTEDDSSGGSGSGSVQSTSTTEKPISADSMKSEKNAVEKRLKQKKLSKEEWEDPWMKSWKALTQEQRDFREVMRETCPCPMEFIVMLGQWNYEDLVEPEPPSSTRVNSFGRALDGSKRLLQAKKLSTDQLMAYTEEIFNHNDFCTFQFLEQVRTLSSTAKLKSFAKILFETWMESPRFTKILLSLCVDSCLSVKARKNKIMKYLNSILYFAEHFTEQYFQNEVVYFLFKKLVTALSLLMCWQNETSMENVYTEPLKIILERVYKRYYSAISKCLEKPFLKLTVALVEISRGGFFAQRFISKLLLTLPEPVPAYISRDLFRLHDSHTLSANQLLFPSKLFLTEKNPDWRKAIVYLVPFQTDTGCPLFWRNWANFITQDVKMLNTLWKEYISEFWARAREAKSLDVRAGAFIALGTAIKSMFNANTPKSASLVLPLTDNYLKMMESTNIKVHHICQVVTYVLFDLMRRQINAAPTLQFKDALKNAGEYAYLVYAYELGEDAPLPGMETWEEIIEEVAQEVGIGCHDLLAGPEQLSKTVRSLRGAELIPSSVMNICDIAMGTTTGKDDTETSVLQQIAVLWIPILLEAKQTLDDKTAKLLTTFAFDSFVENRVKEICVIAVHDLCWKYPEAVCNTLASQLSNNNFSAGHKACLINLLHGMMLYAGEYCCTRCFNTLDEDNRQKIFARVQELEPLFVADYLDLKTFRCRGCKDAIQKAKEDAAEAGVTFVEQVENGGGGGSKSKKGPKTRVWGSRRAKAEAKPAEKFQPHLTIWDVVYEFVSKNIGKMKMDGTGGGEAILMLKIVQLLKFIALTYNSIPQYLFKLVPQVILLIEACKDDAMMSYELWTSLRYLVFKSNELGMLFYHQIMAEGITRDFFKKYLYRHEGRASATDSIICEIMEFFLESEWAPD